MNKKIIYVMMAALLAPSLWLHAQNNRTYSLQDAIEMALQKNPAVNIAQSEVKRSDAMITQAHSYKAPKVDLLTKYFYTNNLPGMYLQALKKVPVMTPTGPVAGEFVPMRPMAPYPGNSRDVLKMDLNLVYPFYTGGKIATANKNAHLLKDIFEKNTRQTKADIAYKVKVAFYNILFLKQAIVVYNEALGQMQQHLDLVKVAYEQGVRSEFDVINFESKIEEFKSRIEDLQGKLIVAKTGLKNLMNVPLTDSIDCSGRLETTKTETLSGKDILKGVQEKNYQLQMLQIKEELFDNLKKINHADDLPKLFTFANYHVYHGMDFPPYDQAWRNGWAAGVGLSFNLFNGNLTKGKVEEAEASKETTQHQREGLKLKLRFEMQSSLEKIASLKAQLTALEKALVVAQKGHDIAMISYKNGVITNVQLEDAHLNILRVETKILMVKKDILIEQANLDFIQGNI